MTQGQFDNSQLELNKILSLFLL